MLNAISIRGAELSPAQAPLPEPLSPTEIFIAAKNHPFYAARLKGAGCFDEAPLTTKEQLHAAVKQVEGSDMARHGVYWSPSGGTSGKPDFLYPTDIDENRAQREIFSGWLGRARIFGPTTVALNLFGAASMTRAGEIFSSYVLSNGGTVFPTGSEAADRYIADIARRFSPDTIMGGIPRLLAFARFSQRSRGRFSFDNLVYGGQAITPGEENYLRSIFGIKNIYGVFGSAETGVWGFGMPELPRNAYIVPRSLVHLELDCPDAAGTGSLVVTNLLRRRFPVLRFVMGDKGCLSSQGDVYRFDFSHRAADEVRIAGQVFSLRDFEQAASSTALVAWQVVVSGSSPERALLRVVPRYPGFNGKILRQAWEKLYAGKAPPVVPLTEISTLAGLKRSATGIKILRVVDERRRR